MPVPTHKPGCQTLHFRPARCNNCDRIVAYWSCSCGSRVLFDETEQPWVKHRCADPTNVTFIKTYTYGVLSTVCPRCGKSVRSKDLNAHNYYTHGIGERPSDLVKQSSSAKRSGRSSASSGPQAKGKRSSKKPTVICKVCNQTMRQSRLEKHMTKAHSDRLSTGTPQIARKGASAEGRLPNGTVPTRPVTECEICSKPVRLDRLEAHMRRVHTKQAARNEIQRGGGG